MERLLLPMLPGGPGYVGWFGKLPSVGDFASRGIPQALRETVHHWIASGMATLAEQQPEDWREAYLVSPVWHFVVNAGVWDSPALIGCIAPSIDKVGRCSPLLALRAFDGRRVREVLPPASEWLYRVDALLRRVIGERLAVDVVLGELERELLSETEQGAAQSTAGDILADLGIVGDGGRNKTWFSWPDLPELFDARNNRSFWWAEPSPRQPPRQIMHSGKPDDHLFGLLMGGWLRA
ncbi:MAG: type VI secretion system-associated protein TagF [Rhodocyclaceae bacterium]